MFGNIYVAGNLLSDTAYFGPFAIYDYGNGNLFLAKYSEGGTPLFAKAEGGSQNESIFGLSTDPLGGNYLTGSLNGNSILGGTLLTGINDILIAKYDHIGVMRWAVKAGSTGMDVGSTVLADTGGYCNAAGHFYGTVNFGPTQLNSVPNEWSIFLSRLGGGTVGVDEQEDAFFSLFPNPAKNVVYLNLEKFTDAIFTIDIISIDGKIISTTNVTQNDNLTAFPLRQESLAAGNYVVKVFSSKGEFTKKVFVAR
jgi:hypothetical protein